MKIETGGALKMGLKDKLIMKDDKGVEENRELKLVVLAQLVRTLSPSVEAYEPAGLVLKMIYESGDPLDGTFGMYFRISEPQRVGAVCKDHRGYGFDFTKSDDDGRPMREAYQDALSFGRALSNNPRFETLVADGIVADRFGWYITKVGE
ncbi:hypothetical protein HN419_05780 [Candidatus Woesearchaeota archaeon]|jgi:hypothetical protein|nr:hypothetical protein [Candidatus Woesearchaeota archaeon]MBT3537620.1 hypothetical protein [Candidatus Woesearchaeota archaeon]MBT4698446.1 hypothetical protein [Candidatus Woesearchaeota archaeon]MBT4716645.1 hypothetical protein [Candidatus Woesearchaeota archaeon]MBT7105289.1 hypothetical protein [Candidatus Woesearchaeota archaeon]